jgi:hypothetical protein
MFGVKGAAAYQHPGIVTYTAQHVGSPISFLPYRRGALVEVPVSGAFEPLVAAEVVKAAAGNPKTGYSTPYLLDSAAALALYQLIFSRSSDRVVSLDPVTGIKDRLRLHAGAARC